MALSTYAANKALDHVLRNTAWTKPTNTYVSLHTADPGLTGANEVSAGWYARQTASWAVATTSGISTNATLTWSAITGSGVTVTHIGLWDASSAGNFLWALDVTDKAYSVGQVPRIASGNVSITIDSNISNYLIPRILDHLTGRATYTQAASVHTALYTSDPTAADSGTEVSGTDYAREATTFSAASSRAVDTAGDTDFGTAGAGGWGTITHYGIRDAASAGNLLVFGSLTSSGNVAASDTFKIPSGSYDIAWN